MKKRLLHKYYTCWFVLICFYVPAKAQIQEGIVMPNAFAVPALTGSNLGTTGSANTITYNEQGEVSVKVLNVITLKIKEGEALYPATGFAATVELNVELTDFNNSVTNQTISLSVTFDKTTGAKYTVRDYKTFKDYKEVKITLATPITITGATGWDPKQMLEVENEMRITRFYDLATLSANLNATITTAQPTADVLQVNWVFPADPAYPSISSARENMTQIEWAYVETEMLPFYNNDYNLLFSNNSTRADVDYKNRLDGYSYKIPLLYPGAGKLYYRVRAVQRKSNGTLITGPWTAVSETANSFAYNGHENNLNWQSSTSFAEGSKYKTVIQYFDGSMRGRQTVTKDNTTGNTVVGETIYDLQGRPNIQILPTPTIDNTIKYFKGFNRFTGMAGNDDPAKYFDLTPAAVKCMASPKLDTAFGNGRYYSGSNDWLGTEAKSAFIPNAQGFAFTETRFTDDATQRVTAQGGVGADHQIGSGHETKYFYGKPSQPELDALFGTEAGDASHYSKNMVKDANGQRSISYTDMHGRTVATSLAGEPTPGIDAIINSVDYPSTTDTIKNDLLTAATNIVQGNSIVSVSTILAASNTAYNFVYILNPAILQLLSCTDQPVCFDCKYDLEISIKSEECGEDVPVIKRYDNLQIVPAANACTTSMGFTGGGLTVPVTQINFDTILPAGSYVIRKTLSINDSLFRARRDSAVKVLLCRTQQQLYDSIVTVLETTTNCGTANPAQSNCDSCNAHLGIFSLYKAKYLFSIAPATATDGEIQILYSEDSTQCSLICGTGNNPQFATLTGIRNQMLADMMPFTGQYATDTIISIGTNPPVPNFNSLDAKFNIFTDYYLLANGTNLSPANKPFFKHPSHETNMPGGFYFTDLNVPDSTIHDAIPGGTQHIIDTVNKFYFSSIYQNKWNESLINYHPEYSKLRYAETTMRPAYDWLDLLQNNTSYAAAVSNNMVNLSVADPYFNLAGTALDKDRLNHYLSVGLSYSTSTTPPGAGPSLWRIANASVLCSTKDSAGKFACMMQTTAGGMSPLITNTADRDAVWENLKTGYLSYRNQMVLQYIDTHDPDPNSLSAADMSELITEGKQLSFARNENIAAQNGWTWWTGITDTTLTDTTGLGVYLATNGLNNCEGQRPYWKARLKQCEVLKNRLQLETNSDSIFVNNIINTILDSLVMVCHNSVTPLQPYGASTVNPSFTGNPRRFEDIVNNVFANNGISTLPGNNYFCNPFTIDYPKPFGLTPPLMVNYSNVLDSCACKRFALLKVEAAAATYDPNNFAGMNQFLWANYHDTLTIEVWAGLQNCNGMFVDTCLSYRSSPSNCTAPVITSLASFSNPAFIKVFYQLSPICESCNIYMYDQNNNIVQTINNICGTSSSVFYITDTCIKYHFIAECYSIACGMLTSNTVYNMGCTPITCTTPTISNVISQGFNHSFQVFFQTTPGCDSCKLFMYDVNGTPVGFNSNVCGLNNYTFSNPSYDSCSKYSFLLKCFKNGCLLTSTTSLTYNYNGCNTLGNTCIAYHLIQLPLAAVIPSFLNCGYLKPCLTCDSFVNKLTPQFRLLYPAYSGVPYIDSTATDEQVKQNALWARFINYRTGFSKNALTYLEAYKSCNTSDTCGSNTGVNSLIVSQRGNPDVLQYKARTEIIFVSGFTSNPLDDFIAFIDPSMDTCTVGQPNPNAIALCSFDLPANDPGDIFPPPPPNPCQDVHTQATYIAGLLFNQMKDSLLANFDSLYRAKCLSAQNAEQFYVKYIPKEYHFTLYYYDQAGNLVKTMPPAAVKPNYNAGYLSSVITARNNNIDFSNPNNNEVLATQYRYNSLNQVVAQKTPDAGISNFWYDKLGRLVVSQNAKQLLENKYSYTLYDSLGRITQVGQKPQTQVMTQSISRDDVALQTWLGDKTNGGGFKEQITRTVYDISYYAGENTLSNPDPTLNILQQSNLRNRVSYTQIIDQEPADGLEIYAAVQAAATYYSYDIHGNVDTLVQDLNKAMTGYAGNRYKKMVYDYDLISGKVNKVSYQPGLTDQFHHKYSYDAENRLIKTETSHDSIYWEKDATYDYYRHGPLSRTELGQNKVQGIDYAYTIQGWLKGVNSTAVNMPDATAGTQSFDMGQDATLTSTIARDAYGYSLNYFSGDYVPLNQATNPFAGITNSLPALTDGIQTGKDLFNGNIRGMMVNIPALAPAGNTGGILYGYRYDQLNRIKAMNSFTGFNNAANIFSNTNVPTASENYKERVIYDPNGNIKTYLRNGTTVSGTPQQMDELTYGYNTIGGNLQNNKLRHVKDAIGNTNYAEDIDDQGDDNYSYDAIGNLVQDKAEGLYDPADPAKKMIEWTVYGKISKITKIKAGVTTTITYTYDAGGNRISKSVTGGAMPGTTFYVRDASGNVMSIYGLNNNINAGALTQTEISEYGSSRLAVWGLNRSVAAIGKVDYGAYSNVMVRGNKNFELSNHLGNVLVTVSDKKLAVSANGTSIDYYTADVVTASDYYPFGMQMPGRKYSQPNSNYRYGFNGKENDKDAGEGIQDYGFRIYNSRLGKFLSVDPLTKKYPELTPYQFASNTPIQAIDLDGLEALFIHGTWSDQSTFSKSFENEMLKATGWSKTQNAGFMINWSGANKSQDRILAAKGIVEWLTSDKNPHRNLKHTTLIGHSHGGNINKLVYNQLIALGWKVDVINIETPQRKDFDAQRNDLRKGLYLNFFSKMDAVQWAGALGESTGRRTDNSADKNIELKEDPKRFYEDAGGHSLHNNPETQKVIISETQKAFDAYNKEYPRNKDWDIKPGKPTPQAEGNAYELYKKEKPKE